LPNAGFLLKADRVAGGAVLRTFDIRGVRYAVEDTGSGPLILFGHGLYFDRTMFRRQAQALSDRFRCVRIDWPGHGDSGWRPNGWSADDLVRDMPELIEALGESSAILVGLSQGGAIFTRTAIAFPQFVRALVVMDATPLALTPEANSRVAAASETLGSGDVHRITALFETNARERMFSEESLRVRPELLSEAMAVFARHNAGALSLAVRVASTYEDLRPKLAELHTPMLLIWGEQDRASPLALAQVYRELVPHLQYVPVANAGHSVVLEQPEVVNRQLAEFLMRLSAMQGVHV
jgi:pimeloyl-ACP methyl ester carboxylesterase